MPLTKAPVKKESPKRKGRSKSLLSPKKRDLRESRVVPAEPFPDAQKKFVDKLLGADLKTGMNPTAFFLPLQDYAQQSSGLLTYCGVIQKFAVVSLPARFKVTFAASFFSDKGFEGKGKDVFSLYFTGGRKPRKAITRQVFKEPMVGWRNYFFEVSDLFVEKPGPHYFEGRLNGVVFQRFPVMVTAISVK